MGDNTTSSPAAQYDGHVSGVNPYYALYHEEALDVVKSVNPNPARWLDTGCGTGTMVLKAAQYFPEAEYTIADPSEAMMELALKKLKGLPVKPVLAGTQRLDLPDNSFDVITAIQSHHYFDENTRRTATENCFRMLKPGGVYITFENVKPFTDEGLKIGLDRWRRYQLNAGRMPEEVERHLSRYGVEYFPITIDDHMELLRCCGFTVAEVLFRGLMQAGFYALKQ